MNDNRTSSILQRLPIILAVTAASYGLPAQAARPAAAKSANSAPATAAQAQLPAKTQPAR